MTYGLTLDEHYRYSPLAQGRAEDGLVQAQPAPGHRVPTIPAFPESDTPPVS